MGESLKGIFTLEICAEGEFRPDADGKTAFLMMVLTYVVAVRRKREVRLTPRVVRYTVVVPARQL